jgi:tRNA (cmo5U34)-methyltransferase
MSNKKDRADAGDGIKTESAGWTFGNDVAKSFSKHVSKSVPLYNLGQDLVLEVSEFFVSPESNIYELGCSTGTLTAKLADKHIDKKINVIGIECEQNMLDQANIENPRDNITYINEDLLYSEITQTDFIVSYYTIQFTHPKVRQLIYNKLYESLNWGGALVVFEKVRAPDARFQDYMTQIYTEFKLKAGYDEKNIITKAKSLKHVLEPFSTKGNYDMMYRAGFKDVMTIQKYVCFEGILAIK